MHTLRIAIGFLASVMQGAMGLFLYMMKIPVGTPNPQDINVHFLGEFMILITGVLFLMTCWGFKPSKI